MATQRQRTILTPGSVDAHAEPVPYDAFYLAAREDRVRMFASMTPQHRSTLMLEHLARWREKNGYRLTKPSSSCSNRYVALPRVRTTRASGWTADFNKMFVALSRELRPHFTPEEIRDLFGVDGDYIPK